MTAEQHQREIAENMLQSAKKLLNIPKIICMCGSTRFTDEMLTIKWEYEKQGIIVLTWNILPSSYTEKLVGKKISHIAEAEGVKEALDELHKRKIDLCDEVFVVDVNSYIGDSTTSEIKYAHKIGKPVKYLEPLWRNDHLDEV